MGDGLIGLKDFVAGLRAELQEAQDARAGDLAFRVGPVEVEFTVVISAEGGPHAAVRFWVIEAGADAKWSKERTQTVRLTLTPVDAQGQDVLIDGRVDARPR